MQIKELLGLDQSPAPSQALHGTASYRTVIFLSRAHLQGRPSFEANLERACFDSELGSPRWGRNHPHSLC